MMLCCIQGLSVIGPPVHITFISLKTRTIISRGQGYGLPSPLPKQSLTSSPEQGNNRWGGPQVAQDGSQWRMQDWGLGNRGAAQAINVAFMHRYTDEEIRVILGRKTV